MTTIYKRIFSEAKQAGILYHITSIKNLLAIIKTNQLQGAIFGISTTRDKNGYKHIKGLAGSGCQLVLDGNKISNNYKIQPYQDTTDKYEDEYEERIKTRLIKNINKYIIMIQLLYPKNWNYSEKDIYILNRLMNKSIDTDFSIDILIDYIKQFFKVEIIGK